MKGKWTKRIIGLIVVVLVIGATVYALLPRPVSVDIGPIDRGPMEVTVDEEGVARIRDIFRVSSPISGRLERLPVHIGDEVIATATEVASIHPMDPPFLDVRSRQESEAAVDAARAAVDLAGAQLNGAVSSRRMADADFERAKSLAATGAISARALEKAAADSESAKALVDQSIAALALRQSELNSASARLIEPDQKLADVPQACCLEVRSPVSGTVIRLISESEQVVAAGTPLLEIGDPGDLEIIVHLLSTDAVNIVPGTRATIDGWGGPVLDAKVVRVDPAAYTKVSALGIEEQRVDAALKLTSPRETWKELGHEFRVVAHLSTWQADDVVRVPLSALFRRGAAWAVYRVIDGRAVSTPIEIGHRSDRFAEVMSGLSAGDAVVLHPSDRVTENVRVEPREDSGG